MFISVMQTLEDVHALEPNVQAAMNIVDEQLAALEGPDLIRAEEINLKQDWAFWKHAYALARAARERQEICAAAHHALTGEHDHIQPEGNIPQAMMKATVHMLWRRLMQLEYGWDPVMQAFTNPVAASMQADEGYESMAQSLLRDAMEDPPM